MTAETPAAPGTETTETPEIVATASNEASSLLEKAGGLVEQAKEAIRAIAGAAYGASKLLDRDDEDADGSVKG